MGGEKACRKKPLRQGGRDSRVRPAWTFKEERKQGLESKKKTSGCPKRSEKVKQFGHDEEGDRVGGKMAKRKITNTQRKGELGRGMAMGRNAKLGFAKNNTSLPPKNRDQ